MMNKKYLIALLGLTLTSTSLPSCIFAAVKVTEKVYDEVEEKRHEGDPNYHKDDSEEHKLLPDGHRIKEVLKD